MRLYKFLSGVVRPSVCRWTASGIFNAQPQATIRNVLICLVLISPLVSPTAHLSLCPHVCHFFLFFRRSLAHATWFSWTCFFILVKSSLDPHWVTDSFISGSESDNQLRLGFWAHNGDSIVLYVWHFKHNPRCLFFFLKNKTNIKKNKAKTDQIYEGKR